MTNQFKWQVAQDLQSQGKGNQEIADILGIHWHRVSAVLAYAKYKGVGKGPPKILHKPAFINGELRHCLMTEAVKRGTSLTALADKILANVIESDLFGAVLDD